MLRRMLDWLWDLQGLTCREATRLAANAMDRPLTFRERSSCLCTICFAAIAGVTCVSFASYESGCGV